MRSRVCLLILLAVVLYAALGASAASGVAPEAVKTPTRAIGDAQVYCDGFHTGGGELASGSIRFEARAASGDPARKNYRPAYGYVDLASNLATYTLSIAQPAQVDIQPGLVYMRGVAPSGAEWSMLAIDNGTPGTLYDELWVTRYLATGDEVSYWLLSAGEFTVR